MIRDYLNSWRKAHLNDNFQEYLDAVALLPKEDQDCAAALWCAVGREDRTCVLKGFHIVDEYHLMLATTQQTLKAEAVRLHEQMENICQGRLDPTGGSAQEILTEVRDLLGQIVG